MSKLALCLKLQILVLFSETAGRLGGKRKLAKNLMLLIVAGCLLYCSIFYSLSILRSFPAEDRSLVIYLLGAASIMMVFTNSLQLAQGMLFAFRDFDYLMSLPIRRSVILISKLFSFLLFCYLYCGFLLIPAIILYGINAGMSLIYYIEAFLGFLFLPFIPMVFSALVSMLIRFFSAKTRWQTLMTNLLSALGYFAIIAGVMLFSFTAEGMTRIDAEVILRPIYRWLPFVAWYAQAIIENDLPLLFASMGVSAFVMMLFAVFSSRSFIRLNSGLRQGYHIRDFRLGALHSQSIFSTLLNKEIRKVLSNVMLILNMAFGQILLIGLAVYVLIRPSSIQEVIGQMGFVAMPEFFRSLIYIMVIGVLVFSALFTNTAASSISLEGKRLWIIKAFPVPLRTLFLAKITANMIVIAVPSSLALILMGLAFGFSAAEILSGFLVIGAAAFFTGCLGLFLNLLFPKLDYDREITVVKQSAASFLAIFGGMLLGGGCFYLLIEFSLTVDLPLLIGALLLILLAAGGLLWLGLCSFGEKLFKRLS